MMKKLLMVMMFLFIAVLTVACEPTTTQGSLNTNITQSTTTLQSTSTTTQSATYIPVTWINIEADSPEICMGSIVNFTVTVQPANASNQNYSITIDPTYLSFVGTNQLSAEVISEDAGGETIETLVTIISDDNASITNTVQIYIHHSGSSYCPIT